MISEEKKILLSLEPLFQKAEQDGLWFHSSYQDLWFSPAELRAFHAKGSFVWGLPCWTLRNPDEKLADIKRAIDYHKKELKIFKKRMVAAKK